MGAESPDNINPQYRRKSDELFWKQCVTKIRGNFWNYTLVAALNRTISNKISPNLGVLRMKQIKIHEPRIYYMMKTTSNNTEGLVLLNLL